LAGRDSLREQLKGISPTSASTNPNNSNDPNNSTDPTAASTSSDSASPNSASSLNGLLSQSQTTANPAYTSLKDALVRKEMDLAEKGAQYDAANALVFSLEEEIRDLQAEISEKKLAMDRLTATLAQSQNTYDTLNEKRIQTQIISAVSVAKAI